MFLRHKRGLELRLIGTLLIIIAAIVIGALIIISLQGKGLDILEKLRSLG